MSVSFSDLIDALKADIALKDAMIKGLSEENTKLRHSQTVFHNVRSKNLNENFRAAQPRRATPFKKRSLSDDGTTTNENFVLGGPASAGVVIQSSETGRGLQFQVSTARANAVNVTARKEHMVDDEITDIQTLPPLSESQTVSFKLTTRQNNRVKGPFLKKPLQVCATQFSNSDGIVFADFKDMNGRLGRDGKLLQARSIVNGPKYMKTNRSNDYRKNVPSFDGRRISFLKD